MWAISVTEHIDRAFKKLSKKNPKRLEIIQKKIEAILANPHQFKPLRAPLQNLRRVHIDKSFILVYQIDERRKTITIMDLDHHDSVYKG